MSKKQTEQQIEMEVRGMTCDACAVHVTRACKGWRACCK